MASLLFPNFAVFQTIFHSLVVTEDHMKRSLKILPGRWLETVRRHQCGEDLRPAGDTEAFALGPFTLCYFQVALVLKFKYLVFYAVSMPVRCVYVNVVAHPHQVPVHLVAHLHVQTLQVCIHESVDACKAKKTFQSSPTSFISETLDHHCVCLPHRASCCSR